MGIRRSINRKRSQQKPSPPNPDILQTRPFGKGIRAGESKLPTTADILRTRPFPSPKPKAAPPEEQPDIQAKLAATEKFGYNAASIPSFAPDEASPIQAKLTIGEPNDRYEQEADQVAARVVSQINSPQTQESGTSQTVQREDMVKEEEEPVQAKLEISAIQREEIPAPEEEEDKQSLQAKLESGAIQREEIPAPEEEEEKQSVQAKLESGAIQREEIPAPEEEEEKQSLQAKLESGAIQREEIPAPEEEDDKQSVQAKLESGAIQREEIPAPEEEDDKQPLQAKLMVQPKSGEGGMAATPDLENSIESARGGGQSLSENIKEPMENAFGADFSGVKVHTDGRSDQLNQSIQARAFTTGQDIFFREGQYDPGSKGGQELLAHELTHVVQQNGAIQMKLSNIPIAYIQPKCSACEIEERKEREKEQIQPKLATNTIIQPDLLSDAAEFVGDVVEGVSNWIDLLSPKRDLLAHMTDPSWIVDSITNVQNQNEAHPKHRFFMSMDLYGVGIGVGSEAMSYVQRIRDCDTRAQVDALREEFDAWKAERQPTFQEELEAKVEEYREVERSWLEQFGNATPETQDPVHPNQSSQNVALSLVPGVPEATVIVETRVNCNFQLTPQAAQDSDGDGNPDVPNWTADEQTHFTDQFQKQLNDVWSTGASATAPFRCSKPADHLLANESPKWSEITANMEARVTLDPTNPHFQLDVFKQAPGERNRAYVNTNRGVFYMDNADAGYVTSGPDAGRRTGAQHTLAHEWHHMIGNPDEYAENSAAQSGDSSTPADLQSRWGDCQQHFQDITNDPASTPEQKQQAQQDLQALQQHATDVDPSTPGFQSGIFPLAGRDDIPDDCFAIRGHWRPTDGSQVLLQPGRQSQRGGTNISASAEDAARLSDRGNEVRPYMREGIVQELQSMLQGRFDPEVSFDHNFQEMTPEQQLETLQARIQNVLHDISDLGSSHEPSGDGMAPDHTDGDGHDHAH